MCHGAKEQARLREARAKPLERGTCELSNFDVLQVVASGSSAGPGAKFWADIEGIGRAGV